MNTQKKEKVLKLFSIGTPLTPATPIEEAPIEEEIEEEEITTETPMS